MPFEFINLSISDVIMIKPKVFQDDRGFFAETYKYSDFLKYGIKENFFQDNHSRSSKNVLRGLHYQKIPRAQGKLVRCVKGEIFDVAVDIRKKSPHYGKWVGARLSEENKTMLYVPPGFAHGFLVITDIAEIIYKTTDEYSFQDERGIIWNDPDINIDWGIDEPLLSGKDKILPLLKDADNNFD
jgi:dTDP-4-dehydrorhamnose 3,5-epimerase